MTNVIPFSYFVKIVSSGLGAGFTVNRLNALMMTCPDTPHETREEYSTLESVGKAYGADSKEYAAAQVFFGYSSKSATMAERLTFWNWQKTATPASILGTRINKLSDIKKTGGFAFSVGGVPQEVSVDLTNATNFEEVATLINAELDKPAMPYSMICGEMVNPTGSVTITANTLSIKTKTPPSRSRSSAGTGAVTFTYAADITIADASDVASIVTALNTSELEAAGFVWSVTGGRLVLTQKVYSDTPAAIPTGIDADDVYAAMFGFTTVTTGGGDDAPLAICNYNPVSGGFTLASVATGSISEITAAAKPITAGATDLSSLLGLSANAGAVIIAGADAQTFIDALNAVGVANGNWVTVSSLDTLAEADYEAAAMWANASAGRYAFIANDGAGVLKTSSTPKYEMLFDNDGFILNASASVKMNAFIQAIIASVDFSATNGALNFNFIPAAAFTAEAVGEGSQLDNVNAQRANAAYIMGGYGQSQTLYGEGNIFGKNFSDISGYIGNTWLKAQMELAAANLFIAQPLIALRGKNGISLIQSVLQSVVNSGLNGGIITPTGIGGLTATERSAVITATGDASVIDLIESNGYFMRPEPLTDEDISLGRLRILFMYTRNVPVNRLSVQNFVLGA